MAKHDLTKAAKHAKAHVPAETGWTLIQAEGAGPFVSRMVHRRPNGSLHTWLSRAHRKRAGLRQRGLWVPSEMTWWIAVLFMIGSSCFGLGSLIGLVPSLFGATLQEPVILNSIFFVGSLFFTSAAYLQLLEAANSDRRAAQARGEVPTQKFCWFGWQPEQIGWLSAAVQFVGTLLFNANTADAMIPGLSWFQEDLVIWVPNVIGSICFLVASWLAVLECFHGICFWKKQGLPGGIVNINLLGSIAFGLSAVFAVGLPSDILNVQAATLWTLVGALCFFVGAALLLPEMIQEDVT